MRGLIIGILRYVNNGLTFESFAKILKCVNYNKMKATEQYSVLFYCLLCCILKVFITFEYVNRDIFV